MSKAFILLSFFFYCFAANACTPVSITSQPSNKTDSVGKSVTFTVVASGTAPFAYAWYENGSAIAGATDSVYTKSNLSMVDSGNYYYCVVSNCNDTVTTDTANLTVIYKCNPLTIVEQPVSNFNQISGDTLHFRVSGTAPITYQWYGYFADYTGHTDGPLSGANASFLDPTYPGDGSYKCIATNCNGSVESNVVGIRNCKPAQVIGGPRDTAVMAGYSAIFTLKLNSGSSPTFQWYVNDSMIQGANSYSYTTDTLYFSDSGNYYYCKITSCDSTQYSDSAFLAITNCAVIVNHPESQTVTESDTAIFSIKVDGIAPFIYKWYYLYDDSSFSFNLLRTDTSSAKTAYYMIPSVDSAKSGYYYCSVAQTTGCTDTKKSKYPPLTVNACDPPSITTQPQHQTANGIYNISYSVAVSGTSPFVYQWYQNGNLISGYDGAYANYTTYEFPKSDTTYTYYCKISNCHGTNVIYSDTARLDPCVLHIASQPVGKTVCELEKATFSVVTTGNKPSQYEWYKNGAKITGATDSTYTTPSLDFADSGNYYYCEIANCGRHNVLKTDTVWLKVNRLPSNLGGDFSICPGTSANVGATAISGHSYLWTSSPSGFTSTIAKPSVSPSVNTTYTLTETITAKGCTNKDSVTITINPLPSAAVGSNQTICSGAGTSIGATHVSGSTYSWSSSPSGFSSTSSYSGVFPTTTTTYTLIETNTSTGCTNKDSVTVTVNPSPSATVVSNNNICLGASTNIGATAVSGNTYSWSSSPSGFSSTSSNPSVSPATTTTYTLTETMTATGCTNKDSVTITINPLPSATVGSDKAICVGASTSIGATSVSGSTYSWSSSPSGFSSTSPNPSVSPTTTTTYTLTETNNYGCIKKDSVTVTVSPSPSATVGSDHTICSGASTSIGATAVSGSTYSWSSSPSGFSSTSSYPSVSPTTTTTYTLTETITATGCKNSNSVTITVNPMPNATVGSDKTICSGVSTSIGATHVSGSGYSWSSNPSGFSSTNSNPLVSPTTTTTYTLTETITATGCQKSNSVTITVNPMPSATVGSNKTICSGDSTSIGATAVSGTTYSWYSMPIGFSSTSSNPLVSPTVTTTYILEVIIASTGCHTSNSVSITVNPFPSATVGSNQTICSGAGTSIGATFVSGNTYSWSSSPSGFSSTSSNPSVSPTTTTTYTLTETNTAAGCTNKDSVTITVNPSSPSATVDSDKTICQGASTSIGTTSVSGSTYSWSSSPSGFSSTSSNPSVSPTTTTTYTLTETNTATGCQKSNSVTITVNPSPSAIVSSDKTICEGASTSIGATAVSGNTYSWSSSRSGFSSTSSNPSVSPNIATQYTLTETITSTGCQDSNSVTIYLVSSPSATVVSDSYICQGASTNIGAAAVTGSTYSWSSSPSGFSSTSSNPSISPTATTMYTLTETNIYTGCTNTDSVTITVFPIPSASVGAAKTICDGSSTTIGDTAVSGNTYSWTSNPSGFTSTSSNPSVSPSVSTTYTLTETITSTGCQKSNSVIIYVNPSPSKTVVSNIAICPGASISIGATAVSGNTYSWSSSPSGFSSTSSNPSVSPTINTTYTLTETITATGCTKTDSVTITVNPLNIITHPQSDAIYYGNIDTFSVVASGAKPYTYQWYQDNVLISGANDSIYITPVLATGDYTFKCLVKNCSGNDEKFSDSATLEVNCHPFITIEPTDQTIEPTTTATFTIKATGDGPFTYKWFVNGSLNKSSFDTFFTTSPLSVSDNGKTVYCVVYGCGDTATSSSKTVKLLVACKLPTIIVQPSNQFVGSRTAATFKVVVNSKVTYSYQWYVKILDYYYYRKDERNYPIYGATSPSFTTSNYYYIYPSFSADPEWCGDNKNQYYLTVTGNYKRKYFCRITSCYGTIESDAVSATVKECDPFFYNQTQSPDTVYSCDKALLFALTTSAYPKPPSKYQWYKNDVPISGAKSSTCITPTITLADSNSYFHCINTGCFGDTGKSNSIKLIILTKNHTASLVNPIVKAALGGEASFKVQSTIAYPDSFAWFVNGTIISGTNSNTLTIPHVISSGNYYYCILYTVCGPLISDTGWISILSCPYTGLGVGYFSVEPSGEFTAYSGESFTVNALNPVEPGKYEWYESLGGGNGTLIATVDSAYGSTYTTPPLTASATYYCKFTSCAGQIYSKKVNVIVKPCVWIKNQPNHVYESDRNLSYNAYNFKNTGRANIDYTVTAEGNGTFTYQWYVYTKEQGSFLPCNSAVFSGSQTAKLTVRYNTAPFGAQFMCVVVSSCGVYAQSNSVWYGFPVHYPEYDYFNAMTMQKANETTLKGKITILLPPDKPKGYISGTFLKIQPDVADPVQVGTGLYTYSHSDFEFGTVGGDMQFGRTYNANNSFLIGTTGYGWRHSFDIRVINEDSIWYVNYPDGQVVPFSPLNDSTGSSVPIYAGTYDRLTQDSLTGTNPKGFTLITKNKLKYEFDSTGFPNHIEDRNGNLTKYVYNNSQYLTSIIGAGGRTITLNYDSAFPVSRITEAITPSGKIYQYKYDTSGNLHSVIEPNGDSTLYTYDSSHLMISVINAFGDSLLTNTYDSFGRVVLQKDVYNQETSMEYRMDSIIKTTIKYANGTSNEVYLDSFWKTIEIVDELGISKTFTYDFQSNLVGIKNPHNNIQNYTYDSIGNIKKLILPGNRIYSTAYNEFSQPVEITDPLHHSTFIKYDLNGNPDTILLADSSQRSYTYYSNGKIESSTDGMGNTFNFMYDSLGDLIKISTPQGDKKFAYNLDGQITSATDEKGNIAYLAYDSNGNLINTKDPLGQQISYNYDLNNKLTSITDKRGLTYQIIYDKLGRVVAKINPMGGIDSFAYDLRDNLIKLTDANGNSVAYTYDAKNRLIRKTGAYGTIIYDYDSLGNLVTLTDPTGITTNYKYNDFNKLSEVTDALDNTAKLTYDSASNVIASADAMGNTTKYAYNAMNRLSGVTDANNGITSFSYNANGILKSMTDANANKQEYNYNSINQLSGFKDAAGHSYSYLYDSTGNLIKTIKPTGTIDEEYDAIHRLTKATLSTGDVYTFSYDADNNLISMHNAVGTSAFVYDSLNRLVQYTNPYNSTLYFGYDAVGNKTSIVYPGNKTVNYVYDKANRLVSVTDWKSNIFNYEYDAAGRILKLNYPGGSHCDYAYDAAGRLISKQNFTNKGDTLSSDVFTLDAGSKRISNKKYNAASNFKSVTYNYTYTKDNVLLSDSVNSYANDSNGNRIGKTGPTDSLKFDYTADNLIKSISSTGYEISIEYDPLGHRIAKKGKDWETNYLLDLSGPVSMVLEMTDSNGAIKADYIYGLGLLEQIDSNGNAIHYYHDAFHNTAAIADANDSILASYTYNSFGEILSKSGTLIQPFTFLGEYGVEQDSSSLYYIRARYYDAVSGRFISKDVMDGNPMNPQTFNKYVYSVNNPISIFDVTGYTGKQDGSPNAVSTTAYELNSGNSSTNVLNASASYGLTGANASVSVLTNTTSFNGGTTTTTLGEIGANASIGLGVKVSVTATFITNKTVFDVGNGFNLTATSTVLSTTAGAKIGKEGFESNVGATLVAESASAGSKYGSAGAGVEIGIGAKAVAGYKDGTINLGLDFAIGIGVSFNISIDFVEIGNAIASAFGFGNKMSSDEWYHHCVAQFLKDNL